MIINYRRRMIVCLLGLVVALFLATGAYAHGVVITYTLKANGEVELSAEFDTGEAMGEAQVTVYSPEDPLTPWLTGAADAEGRYVFVIDPELPGIWDIQFRKAGHGDIIHLQLEAGMVDPALLEQPPGELIPAAPVAEAEAPAETGATSPGDPPGSQATAEAAPELSEPGLKATETAAAEAGPETAEEKTDQMVATTEVEALAVVTTAAAEPTVEVEKTAPAPVESAANAAGVTGAGDAADTPAAHPAPARAEAPVISGGGNTAAGGGFSSFQILLMSASVIWGFVGTALYFSNRKTTTHGHDHHSHD